MSFVAKSARLSKRSAIYISKQNTSTSRAAMSTISAAIKKDHQEIKEYANNIRGATDDDSKTRWQNQFTWELARHSIGEELIVYPAFEKYLGVKGQELADKDRREHQSVCSNLFAKEKAVNVEINEQSQVKEALKKFQNLEPASPEFLTALEALMKDLSAHIQEEEDDDLPALETAIQTAESESLAKSFGRTKAFVPSRSHPSAPDKPPFETAVGLLTAPIDNLADMFRKFPDKTISPNPSTK
jgi:hemerythrin superfamily protein